MVLAADNISIGLCLLAHRRSSDSGDIVDDACADAPRSATSVLSCIPGTWDIPGARKSRATLL